MDDSGKLVIRSFRLVFDRGYRRLFKIDRYRLPFAYGLPILGIVYAALVALALVTVARLPVVGPGLAALPPPIHWVAIPVGLSMVMLQRSRLALPLLVQGSAPDLTGDALARLGIRGAWRDDCCNVAIY